MAYSIIVSPRAQIEIENSVAHYAQDSTDAPILFITALRDTYKVLSINPFFKIRYKNVRALRIKRFPYMLYFVIDESKNKVRILSCFHGMRDPDLRPRM